MDDGARLHRLKRIARLRAVERHEAMRSTAEATLAEGRSRELAARTREIFARHAAPGHPTKAVELIQVLRFAGQMAGVSRSSEDDARQMADAAGAERANLARVERRRDMVAERLKAEENAFSARLLGDDVNLARNLKGTGRSKFSR